MSKRLVALLSIVGLLALAGITSLSTEAWGEAGPTQHTDGMALSETAPRSVSPAQSTTCNSCADCTSKLASGLYTEVTLEVDITDHFGSCISLLYSANSGLTFNCAGHTIDGDDIPGHEVLDAGIEMMNNDHNFIQSCIITDFDVGIYLRSTTEHTISYSTADSNVYYGLYLNRSNNNDVYGSHFEENYDGIRLEESTTNQIDWATVCGNTNLDFSLLNSAGNTGDNNYCDKPDGWNDQGATGCSQNCAGSTTCSSCADCSSKLDGTYRTVILTDDINNASSTCITFGGDNIEFNCNGYTIDGDDAGSDYGIIIAGHSGDSVRNCIVKGFNTGIFLATAVSNTIDQNQLSWNTYAGLYLQSADDNILSSNQIESNGSYGLYLYTSSNNQIQLNEIHCGPAGLVLQDTHTNSLTANTVCSNPGPDIQVLGTSVGNSGTSNACDSTSGWNDQGATGCTRLCNSQRCGTCSDGIQGANEDGVDCGGTYCPPCSQCAGEPTNKYAPHDTVCNNKWPTTEGHLFFQNTLSYACNMFEVCNPDLDYIIEDALLCCEYTDYSTRLSGDRLNEKIAACNYAHKQAYQGRFSYLFNPTSLDQCLGHYIIHSLGRSGAYMQGYFYGELCCFGHGLCPSTCSSFEVAPPAWEMGDATNCRGEASKSPDYQMGGHSCFFQNYGLWKWGWWGWWHSDTDWQANSDSFCDTPTHASINRLSTGTCVDYSYAVTTLLRKAGYSKDDALSVSGRSHAYNLVRFPGEAKWHYVDTTGNTAAGVMGGSGFIDPIKTGYTKGGAYRYCSAMTGGCVNDVVGLSKGHCPSNSMIYGCEWTPQPFSAPSPPPPVVDTGVSDDRPADLPRDTVEQGCSELNPCLEEHTAVAQPPGPRLALEIVKGISSNQVTLGQELQVWVRVENYESTPIDATVVETFLTGGIRYDLVPEEESLEGLTVQYHQWNVQVPAGSAETVAFTIVPSTTGYFDLGSSAVYVEDRDYWTLPVTLTVMCNPNGVCDPGENYLTCPADCLTGIQDDLCDMVADGFQDPDCAYGVDPDYFPLADTDGDGVLDGFDACHLTPDGEPTDASGCACAQKICDDEDEETVDRCLWETAVCTYLPDADQDEVPDSEDNCPNAFNPGQEDWDDDGTGDQCMLGYIESDVTLQPGTYHIADPELDGALTIVTSNVTLDCNGAAILGDGQGVGVYVPFYVNNVTIRNCNVQGYRYGVFVDGGGQVQITDNVLQQNVYGIVLGYAAANTVSGNTASHNTADGIYLEGSDGNSIDGNTALWNGQGGIFLHTSNGNDISNNRACGHPYSDFIVITSTNSGSNNSCDVPDGWNDDGIVGCTSACGYAYIYLPLVIKDH